MCNLTVFKKRTQYLGFKVSNNLPPSIKNIVYEVKAFKFALTRFLLLNSFYSLEEYFNYNTDYRFWIVIGCVNSSTVYAISFHSFISVNFP
jgi:hypothetical protein